MRSWFDGIHYMEIFKARVADSGVIRLVARNKLGMVEFKTKLEVKPKEASLPLLKPTPKGNISYNEKYLDLKKN